MEDKELFELCKQVYEKTGWDDTDSICVFYGTHWDKKHETMAYNIGLTNAHHPLYTSDYVLEKLDFTKRNEKLGTKVKQVHLVKEDDSNYRAFCPFVTNVGYADTPLKALLKLTLALHDAGELK